MVTIRAPKKPLLFSKGRTFRMISEKPWGYDIDSKRGNQFVSLKKAHTTNKEIRAAKDPTGNPT